MKSWEGMVLSNRLRQAQTESNRQKKSHDNFSKGFPSRIIKEIEYSIEIWMGDPEGSPNPFKENKTSELKIYLFMVIEF